MVKNSPARSVTIMSISQARGGPCMIIVKAEGAFSWIAVMYSCPRIGCMISPASPPGDPVCSHPVPLLLCGEVFLVDVVDGRKGRDQEPEEGDCGGDPVEGEFPEGRVEPERHRLVKRHREQPCFGEGKRLHARRQHPGGEGIDGDGLDKDADRVAEPEREVHAGPDPVPGEPEGEEQEDDDPPIEDEVGKERPPVEVEDVHGEVREERDKGHHPPPPQTSTPPPRRG